MRNLSYFFGNKYQFWCTCDPYLKDATPLITLQPIHKVFISGKTPQYSGNSAAVFAAFSAKFVVGNAIFFIQKQRPLLFPFLAHSRHSNQSSFPAENIKTTGKIHSALFMSFPGAKNRVNIPSKPLKKHTRYLY